MPRSSRTLGIAAAGLLAAALLLAACGRKGPLDLPPSSTVQPPSSDGQAGSGDTSAQRGAPPMEYGANGKPLAPRGHKKKLPVDFLID